MTVAYSQQVATERVGGFFRLLFRWRGSIYRAVYGEIAIFLILYYSLNLSYLALTGTQQTKLAEFCKSCEDFADYIPVTFIVGFYTVRAISRRWTQWENMPWPDKLVFNVSGNLHGTDVKSRMLRRTIARYVNLGSILCFRDISIPVKKRFPTLEYLINAGLLTPEEHKLYEETICEKDTNWWIPFHWAFVLVEKAKDEERLDSGQMNKLRDDIMDLRQKCWVLFSHDWIPVPMVYSQVVTLAVYMFMLACLFGRQSFASTPPMVIDEKVNGTDIFTQISGAKRHAEYYFPFFTVCQVIFYLGWLKVAEILINPMGSDADDFEMNYIIDRNMRVSYTVVDYSYNRLPPIEKDIHWDAEEPELPHTVGSAKAGTVPFIGSAAKINISNKQAGITDGATKDLVNGSVTSRQTSANAPSSASPAVQPAMHSKSEKYVPALLRPISRLLSKDNEILDSIKAPTAATSPATKPNKAKKDGGAPLTDEIPLQSLERGKGDAEEVGGQDQAASRTQSARLSKIDESNEVLIELLNESAREKAKEGDIESMFFLTESPPPKPPRPAFPIPPPSSSEQKDESDQPGVRMRHVLPHQQRNAPSADSPPVATTKEPPSVL